MKSDLAQAIDSSWILCRSALSAYADVSHLPTNLSELIRGFATGNVSQAETALKRSVDLTQLDKKTQKAAEEVLKLFDASSNGYRSVTNVFLEYLKLQRNFNNGDYNLWVGNFALIDGFIAYEDVSTSNKSKCPICNRFPQNRTVYALLSGNPQTDSLYQTYQNRAGKRENMEVCQYCFTAGWVDLPTARLIKDGNTISKQRDYLFITTPVAKSRLEKILNAIIRQEQQEDAEEEQEISSEDLADFDSLASFLRSEFNIEPRDSLSILGISTRRLSELRGFVLQSSNLLFRTVVVRVPIERLVGGKGEIKVSGAVRRELMKAAMYDFWLIVGGSLHYGSVRNDSPYSVLGKSITLEEMFQANRSYRIADRYGRMGKYRQLNSGLFMLLFSAPRQAANRILNLRRREKGGRTAPNREKIKEIIEMVEEISDHNDWQFKLGLRIVETLVGLGLTPRAKSFWKNQREQYTGVELVKWIQRLKMIRDTDSARAWGTSLVNGYRREHGYGPNAETVAKIIDLVEEIIRTCEKHDDTTLSEFARNVAGMDYYLLFYHNHNSASVQAIEE
jgi:hypothetical protein